MPRDEPMPSQSFYRRLIPLVMIPHASVVERLVFRWTSRSLFNPIMTRASGFEPRPCLFLRTVHWNTGRTRDMVLPYLRDGDAYVVTGSLAGRPKDPVWATNVRAHGIAWIRVDGDWLFCDAHVAQGEERARLWKKNSPDGEYEGYARMAHPRILPLVVLFPRDSALAKRPSDDRAVVGTVPGSNHG